MYRYASIDIVVLACNLSIVINFSSILIFLLQIMPRHSFNAQQLSIFFSTDINECIDDPIPCHLNATCTNIDGNYTCTCDPGFSGTGKICTSIYNCY